MSDMGEIATALETVPRELLMPLAKDESRGVYKEDAAPYLDRFLRQLARREVLSRYVLGRIADRFLERRAHFALAFARVGDYTRERLGLSASHFYECARVARTLASFSRLREGFLAERISWTKLREIAPVVEQSTEIDWADLAECYTADGVRLVARTYKRSPATYAARRTRPLWLRELADEIVREHCESETVRDAPATVENAASGIAPAEMTAAGPKRAGRPVDPATAGGRATVGFDHAEIDGEAARVFTMRCPSRVARLWREVSELASRSAGAELAPWQAAELIAAEALADTPLAAEPGPVGATDGRARRRRLGEPRMLKPHYLREAHAGCGTRDPDNDFDAIDANRAHLDMVPLGETLPDPLEALADGIDDADAHELDRRMRILLASTQRIDAQLGALLRTFFGLSLHLELGYLSQGSYVRNRLGLCSRKARALVAIERRAVNGGAAALREAYRCGVLPWYRCLLLASVVDGDTVDAWIERARSVTFCRLRREIDWALAVMGNSAVPTPVWPPPPHSSLRRVPCPSCGNEHDWTAAGLDDTGVARRAEGRLGQTTQATAAYHDDMRAGFTSPTSCATENACAAASDAPLANDEWQIGGHGAAATSLAGAPPRAEHDARAIGAGSPEPPSRACPALLHQRYLPATAEIRFPGPESVVFLLESAIRARTRPGRLPWQALEELLIAVHAEWMRGAKHRDPVFERDDWHCQAPGCSARRNLHDHHIVFRSHGGSNDLDNRVTLCAWHHLRGVHAGRMRVSGTVATGLTWELGLRRDATAPLMTTRGDWYVAGC